MDAKGTCIPWYHFSRLPSMKQVNVNAKTMLIHLQFIDRDGTTTRNFGSEKASVVAILSIEWSLEASLDDSFVAGYSLHHQLSMLTPNNSEVLLRGRPLLLLGASSRSRVALSFACKCPSFITVSRDVSEDQSRE